MKTFLALKRKTGIKYGFFLLYLISAITLSVSAVVSNQLSGEMNTAALERNTEDLLHFFIFMTIILVIRAVAVAAKTYMTARANANAGYRLRNVFINHFLNIPFPELEKKPSGEHLSLFSNDLPQARGFMTSNFLDVVSSVISFLTAVAFLLYIDRHLTGIVFLAALGLLVLVALLNLPIMTSQKRMSKKQAEFNAVINDSLQNLSVISAYSLNEVIEARYIKAYDSFFAEFRRFAKFIAISVGGMFTALFAPLVVIVTFLALRTISEDMYLSEFIAFALTVVMVGGGSLELGQGIGTFISSLGRAKRVNEETSAQHENLDNGTMPQIAPAKISFSNVSFTYTAENNEKEKETPKKKKGLSISFSSAPQDEEIKEVKEETKEAEKETTSKLALDNTTFEIKPGSKVAIVGGSGSGKSTILKLLLGLYAPQSGEISIEGQNINGFAKKGLREFFAYVPQDSFLFPESIGKNITMEDSITDMPRLEKACANAGILEFINTLPNRFDSILTESADNVSGGQRQRIAMARAFYKNAPIILFDEATSSLDPITEAAILNTFTGATSDKTVIVVAHRATAIASCDSIIVMESGKAVGIGTHDELIANCAVYKELYNKEAKEGDAQ